MDIRLRHRRKRMAVLIELESSEKQRDMQRDANKTLKQIEVSKFGVFRTFSLFENMVSLAFTLVHMSKGDTWSSMVTRVENDER